MPDQCTCCIQLRGPVDVDELNALTPLRMTRVQADTPTLMTASTDQAGLIALMRHLHGLGFQFLSVSREPDRSRIKGECMESRNVRSRPESGC